MGNCESYDACIQRERKNMRYPVDTQSLYAKRIVDNQTANRRCYQRNPIHIVEGFGNKNVMEILKWIILLVIIYFTVTYVMNYMTKETVKINVGTEIQNSDTPEFIKELFKDM